jgi:ubiquinone/menaquinone biosynthesis C-methylase UbiE
MSHDKHQEFYDELAQEWDYWYTAVDLDYLTFKIDGLEVKEGWDLLDIGCGTGILFDLLRRRVGEKGTVTGVDFSIQMALKAHRNFPFPNVNVVDGDVNLLPFRDNTFDMGISVRSFDDFPDKAKALSEIRRVLKPGSAFVILHLYSSKELSEVHHEMGGAVYDDVMPTKEEMQLLLQNGGFNDIVVEDQPGHYLAMATVKK